MNNNHDSIWQADDTFAMMFDPARMRTDTSRAKIPVQGKHPCLALADLYHRFMFVPGPEIYGDQILIIPCQ